MSKSKISWTEQTWNPIVGCSIASKGCKNCYAMKMAARLEAMGVAHYAGTTQKVNGNTVWTGKLTRAPESVLIKPLKRKKPTTYFVNSMSDLFHEDIPDEWIDQVFDVMEQCPQHTFQILTKRSERMLNYSKRLQKRIEKHASECINFGFESTIKYPLKNVWLGVSAEDQKQANVRIPYLLNTPAAIRFISLEPQLEFIDLMHLKHDPDNEEYELNSLDGYLVDTLFCETTSLDWVIQGCESGPGARPFKLPWASSIRDQCKVTHVPYFLKQIQSTCGRIIKDPFLGGVQHLAMPGGE